MTINLQLMKTLIQLQAMQSLNNTSSPDSLMSSDGTDDFSTLLTTLLGKTGAVVDSGATTGLNTSIDALGLETGFQPLSTDEASNDPSEFDAYINEAAAKYHVDPKLVKSVIHHESSFNPLSVSPAGAMGLMQLMPGTARGLGVTDPFDAKQNIEGGTKYLRQLLDTFGNNETLAVAAYNAGPANVKKYNGIPPFQETQNYVRKVLGSYMS